jgi:predicted nucleic acid-binding protein
LTTPDAAAWKDRSAIDGLLAATAIHHNLTIVSRNVEDFAGMQVLTLNPWDV